MASVLEGMFGIPRGQVLLYVGLALLVTAIYSAVSGLWGVALTDAFQFVLAMAGTDRARRRGAGPARDRRPLRPARAASGVDAAHDAGHRRRRRRRRSRAPSRSPSARSSPTWACSGGPPGTRARSPGGGGYIAQRMMSAKDEKHSLLATLWFQIAHYCVRPWPWIIVGLASLVLYPELGARREAAGLRLRDARPPARRPARDAGGVVLRRLHVHHRHAAQLGHLVRDERLLPAVRQPRGAARRRSCSSRA